MNSASLPLISLAVMPVLKSLFMGGKPNKKKKGFFFPLGSCVIEARHYLCFF